MHKRDLLIGPSTAKVLELGSSLSALTRRVGTVRGAWRVTEPLRQFYAAWYRESKNPWAVIDKFDGNLKLCVDRSSYIGSSIYWRGHHSVDELLCLDGILKPQMVFVDIGANQGEFTVYAAKRLPAGKVLAFEPVDSNFAFLTENIRLNEFKTVTAHKLGLSDQAGYFELYTSDDHEVHHSFNEGLASMFRSNHRATKLGAVRVEVFDDVFAESGLNRVDVIKVDVEGAELPVLRGAYSTLKRHKPAVIMEVNEETFNTAGYTTNDVVDFLERLNYTIFLIGRYGKVVRAKPRELPNLGNILCW